MVVATWRRSLEIDELRIMMTCSLPGDIMINNILPRLPVGTLLLNKMVNKTWYALMENRTFQELQFDMTGAHQEDRHYVVQREFERSGYLHILSPKACSSLHLQRGGPKRGMHIAIGSANGVICFTPQDARYGFDFTLINPTYLLEFMYPVLESRKSKGYISLGFGYDSRNKDFKIVRVEQYEVSGQIHTICDIYTNNNDSWRTFEPVIDGLLQQPMDHLGETRVGDRAGVRACAATYVNGALHWLALRGNRSFIVSFDLSQEVFGEILLPDTAPVICSQLHVWRDHLAAIYYYGWNEENRNRFEIWMMAEYGLSGSWERVRMYGPFSRLVIFRTRMANGQLMLYNTSTNRLVMYNPDGNEISNVAIKGRELPLASSRLDVLNYKASLIKVHGSTPYNYWKAWKEACYTIAPALCVCLLGLYLISFLSPPVAPDELYRR